MITDLKEWLKNYPSFRSFVKSPVNWLYAAYLTLRYVDNYSIFPAFQLNGSIRIKIKKHRKGRLNIKERLVLEQWMFGEERISLNLSKDSILNINKEFVIGNGVRIFLAPAAELTIEGKDKESASGITANSIIMVNKYLRIGKDCIIAWDTFITDCDWHKIEGKHPVKETIIRDHVWIGVGAKVLKGALIGENCIVTAQSVVLEGNYENNTLISGAPAKIVKLNISSWNRELHM